MESLLIRNSSKCRLTDKLQMRVPKNKILQICHSDGKIKIDEERIVENGIEVTGVVELRALYVVSDDEMPFYAAETAIPFRHTIEVPESHRTAATNSSPPLTSSPQPCRTAATSKPKSY